MTDAVAGKWDFKDDAERREAIEEEARINQEGALAVAEENRRAAADVAEANGPVWHWAVFWAGFFALLIVNVIYRH
jgi:hypothetical protein